MSDNELFEFFFLVLFLVLVRICSHKAPGVAAKKGKEQREDTRRPCRIKASTSIRYVEGGQQQLYFRPTWYVALNRIFDKGSLFFDSLFLPSPKKGKKQLSVCTTIRRGPALYCARAKCIRPHPSVEQFGSMWQLHVVFLNDQSCLGGRIQQIFVPNSKRCFLRKICTGK